MKKSKNKVILRRFDLPSPRLWTPARARRSRRSGCGWWSPSASPTASSTSPPAGQAAPATSTSPPQSLAPCRTPWPGTWCTGRCSCRSILTPAPPLYPPVPATCPLWTSPTTMGSRTTGGSMMKESPAPRWTCRLHSLPVSRRQRYPTKNWQRLECVVKA